MRGFPPAAWRVGIGFLLVGCTDPRARPVPPDVQVQFSSSFKLTSPGLLSGTIFLFDTDGLKSLTMSVRSDDDSSFVADSIIALTGDAQVTHPINWTVPAGLATGGSLRFIARATDFLDFAASDTVTLTIQSAILTGH